MINHRPVIDWQAVAAAGVLHNAYHSFHFESDVVLFCEVGPECSDVNHEW